MLDDAALLAELADRTIRHPDAGEQPDLRYIARVVGLGDHQLDVELSQNGVTARTWIALPESLRPMPWLGECASVDDPRAWIGQLTEWLDEEMYTGGLGPAYARLTVDHQSRLVVDGYGFRLADEADHRRLRRAVGPHGRLAPMSKRQIRKQYAAESALDWVEQQIRRDPLAEFIGAGEFEWSVTPPEGVPVHVAAYAEFHGGHSVGFMLHAHAGRRGKPVGRRRVSRAISET